MEYEKYDPEFDNRKFNGPVAYYLYQLSMVSGQNDEIGSCQDMGWYGRFDDIQDIEPIHDASPDNWGAILLEDSQGFVDAYEYSTKEDLDKAWENLTTEYLEYYEQNESDAEDHANENGY